MLPGLAAADAFAHLGGRDRRKPAVNGERSDAPLHFIGRLEISSSRRHQHLELFQHSLEGIRVPVIPVEDALGGVATANEY